MATTVLPTDLQVQGNLSVTGATSISAGSVSDTEIAANASIDIAKLDHVYTFGSHFNVEYDAAPAGTVDFPIFLANGIYTIRSFQALLADTGTTTDIDFDLLKNGTTVLSAAINITNADTDAVPKTGTISVGTTADDDVLTVRMTVTTATGALGPYCFVSLSGPEY